MISVKRASDLRVGDCLQLPPQMLPPDAIVESIRPIRTMKGQKIYVCQLKTLGETSQWAFEAGLYPDERVKYYKGPGKFKRTLKWLNARLNPLTFFSQ